MCLLLFLFVSGEFVEFLRSKPVYKETSGTRKCRCTSKMVTRQLGPGQFQMFPEEVCDSCPNKRLVTEERTLEFEIESGMTDGQQYRFNGMLCRCITDSKTLSCIQRVDTLFSTPRTFHTSIYRCLLKISQYLSRQHKL